MHAVCARTAVATDDRALAADGGRARRRGTSVGQALSELVLIGYEAEQDAPQVGAGLPVLPAVDGHLITSDVVDDALDEP